MRILLQCQDKEFSSNQPLSNLGCRGRRDNRTISEGIDYYRGVIAVTWRVKWPDFSSGAPHAEVHEGTDLCQHDVHARGAIWSVTRAMTRSRADVSRQIAILAVGAHSKRRMRSPRILLWREPLAPVTDFVASVSDGD
jgi:hypothetical protein